MPEKTLLEKTKELVSKNDKRRFKIQVTKEHIELCIAMLKGEITTRQFTITIGKSKGTNPYGYICMMLSSGLVNGIFEVKYK